MNVPFIIHLDDQSITVAVQDSRGGLVTATGRDYFEARNIIPARVIEAEEQFRRSLKKERVQSGVQRRNKKQAEPR